MPKSKIDETIKKLASKASTDRSSSFASAPIRNDLPGDPNCPHCHGVGYLRNDVPMGHHDFGKLEICVCRRASVTNGVRDRLFAISHLDELKDLTFESFKLRGRKGLGDMQARSIEQAYNHARMYSQNLNGWLLLQGGYGCGKTHLAAGHFKFCGWNGRADFIPNRTKLVGYFEMKRLLFRKEFHLSYNQMVPVLSQ